MAIQSRLAQMEHFDEYEYLKCILRLSNQIYEYSAFNNTHSFKEVLHTVKNTHSFKENHC